MNDNDELNDSAVLSAVRDSISGLPMPAAPRLQAITARGRARRRRRLGGLSIAGAGACAALAVGLACGSGLRRASATARAASGPSGGVSCRHRPWRHDDPDPVPAAGDDFRARVRRALAEHGIPALVTAGSFCRTADQPPPGVGQVVVLPHRTLQVTGGQRHLPARTGGPGPIVIYGSAIPSGVELSIGYRQDPQDREISFSLIQALAPLGPASAFPITGHIPDNGPLRP